MLKGLQAQQKAQNVRVREGRTYLSIYDRGACLLAIVAKMKAGSMKGYYVVRCCTDSAERRAQHPQYWRGIGVTTYRLGVGWAMRAAGKEGYLEEVHRFKVMEEDLFWWHLPTEQEPVAATTERAGMHFLPNGYSSFHRFDAMMCTMLGGCPETFLLERAEMGTSLSNLWLGSSLGIENGDFHCVDALVGIGVISVIDGRMTLTDLGRRQLLAHRASATG